MVMACAMRLQRRTNRLVVLSALFLMIARDPGVMPEVLRTSGSQGRRFRTGGIIITPPPPLLLNHLRLNSFCGTWIPTRRCS